MALIKRGSRGSVGESQCCTGVGLTIPSFPVHPQHNGKRFLISSALVLVYDVTHDGNAIDGLCSAPILDCGTGSRVGSLKAVDDLTGAVLQPFTGSVWIEPTGDLTRALPLSGPTDPAPGTPIHVYRHDGSRIRGRVVGVGVDFKPYAALQTIFDGFTIAPEQPLLYPQDSGAIILPENGDGTGWLGMFLQNTGALAFCSRATRIVDLPVTCP